VINKDSMSLAKYRQKVQGYKNISIYKVPESVALGACLNYAVSKTKYHFIAKFDDDDYYLPYCMFWIMKRRAGEGNPALVHGLFLFCLFKINNFT